MVAFGCSDKKKPTPKTQDSPKSVASPTTLPTNQIIEKKNITPQPIVEEISPPPPRVSGVQVQVSGVSSSPHVSGRVASHISGQPRHSSNISGSRSHVSGNVARPRISGQ